MDNLLTKGANRRIGLQRIEGNHPKGNIPSSEPAKSTWFEGVLGGYGTKWLCTERAYRYDGERP